MASLGVSWSEAGHVVVSAVGIYLAFLVLLRVVGQRALASMSSFDFAAAIAVGAVMGRSLLGYTPTLLAGRGWQDHAEGLSAIPEASRRASSQLLSASRSLS